MRQANDNQVRPTVTGRLSAVSPHFSVEEAETHFIVSAKLPESQKKCLKIEVLGNNLFVSGERHREHVSVKNGQEIVERSASGFQRVFTFPSRLEKEKVEANYRDGTLKIHLPKTQSDDRREVQIEDREMEEL